MRLCLKEREMNINKNTIYIFFYQQLTRRSSFCWPSMLICYSWNKGGPRAWHNGPCFLASIVTDPEMSGWICIDQTFSEAFFSFTRSLWFSGGWLSHYIKNGNSFCRCWTQIFLPIIKRRQWKGNDNQIETLLVKAGKMAQQVNDQPQKSGKLRVNPRTCVKS